jgi:hypothetical protein
MDDSPFLKAPLISQVIEEARGKILKWLARSTLILKTWDDHQTQHLLYRVPCFFFYSLTSFVGFTPSAMFFNPMQCEPFNVPGQFFQFRRPVLPGEFPKFHQKRNAS